MGDEKLRVILTAKDLTGAVFDKVQGRVKVLTSTLFSLQGIALTLSGGYGLGRLGESALDTAAGFEQMQIKLDALTKGAGEATLQRLNLWAIEMPVNTKKAVDTFVMMQAMGLAPTIEKMQTLVDVSSLFGEDAMPRVARALGQMQTLGKLSAEELNQLSEAGINARKYLTEAFGMTVEELKKSQVSIEEIIEAIWKGLDADYSGSAKKTMRSWKGLTTTFASYWTEAERKVMGAGVFDELKIRMEDVNREFDTWLRTNGALIEQRVPEYVDQVTDATGRLYDKLRTGVAIYQGLPDEVVGAAGYGIAGRIIFGGWGPARIIFAVSLLNNSLGKFNLNIGAIGKDLSDAGGAMDKIWEVLTGQRDWNTGALKGQAADLFNLSVAAQQSIAQSAAIPAGILDYGSGASTSPAASGASAAIQAVTQDAELMARAVIQETEMREEALRTYIEQSNREIAVEQAKEQAIVEMRSDAVMQEVELKEQALRDYIEQNNREAEAEMEAIRKAEEKAREHYAGMRQLTQETARAMQQSFSDFFFDVLEGEFEDLGDVAGGVLSAINQSIASLMGQWTTQSLFGDLTKEGGSLGGLFGALFASAKGNVFGPGGPVPFASGGVITRPVLFPFAGGVGLAGEKGYEAIMPLSRTPGGDLGVKAQVGGGAVSVEVHNYSGAQATTQESTAPDGRRLVRVIIGEAADSIRSGGDLASAMAQTYGLRRAATLRG